MDNKKMIKIDPEKFAYSVMESMPIKDAEGVEAISKQKLLQYLSAYYLAVDFNSYEFNMIDEAKKGEAYPSYMQVLEKMNATMWRS